MKIYSFYKSIYFINKKYFYAYQELVLDRFRNLVKEKLKRHYNLQEKDETDNSNTNKDKTYTAKTNKVDNKYYIIVIDFDDQKYINQNYIKFVPFTPTNN